MLEIDGASNTGVDDVRELRENVRYQPATSRFKIYIIDEVHMLSTSAFNALLKTLEEPPPHVKFIFATTEPHKVPHTILSRCQRYDFKRIPFRLIADRLAEIARSEGVTVSDRALFLIAREGEGSMRDAQSLLDQVIAFAGKDIRDEDVVARAWASPIASCCTRPPKPSSIAIPARALELLERAAPLRLRHAPLRARAARTFPQPGGGTAAAGRGPAPGSARRGTRRSQSPGSRSGSSEDLDRAFRLLLGAEGEVGRVPYPKLVLEMTFIKLATLTPVVAGGELLDRIEDLERRLNDGHNPRAAEVQRQVARRQRRRAEKPAARSALRAGRRRPSLSEATPTRRRARTWQEFLDFVRKEKITLLPYLKSSQPP